MEIIVHDVFELKNRGTIISVPCGSSFILNPGDVFECGVHSWVIRSTENYDGFMRLILLIPVEESKPPIRGYILSKKDSN